MINAFFFIKSIFLVFIIYIYTLHCFIIIFRAKNIFMIKGYILENIKWVKDYLIFYKL